MENWLEVCSSRLSQIAGFHKDPAWSVLAFFCDGYRGDTKTSFGFKEEVIHFSRNTGSEAPPHSVAGVCLLNVTTRPRACHLMLCLPLRSRRSPFSMQRERVRDSRRPRACCGEAAHGIDFISPPCPRSLIAPQQTCAAGKLPAARAQGFRSGAGVGRLWVRWEDLRLFSLL